ncbi:aminoglycoside phosphotransferase family protein [Dyella silvatica]|uniref:aminoglycoside phosphotransferase family protein n=1 Tax=Dyella silvatica TaxID=2992128 RepID=UPI0022577E97|nr:phosphotransferase [Dyella silvatica]
MSRSDDRALSRLGWTRAVLGDTQLTLAPASADASFRSYWRTYHQDRSWIVMDSPPAQEDPRPWVEIGKQLDAAGLHVPQVHAQDLQQGFLLIEDLGNRLYLGELTDTSADTLYGDAMDALLRIQTRMSAEGLPAYDQAFLTRELEVMPEWLLDRHLGHALDADERAVLDDAFGIILHSALEQPRGFVHRDFHSRNLLIVAAPENRRDAERLHTPGIIDFQGALAGPIAYDLASLLRDCYIAWEPERVEAWAVGYFERLRHTGLLDASVDRARFLRWFDLIGLQRHIKVLGQFYRLWYRDGKPGYLADVPRVYHYVISVARRYPELTRFVTLLERRAEGRDLTQVAAA